MSFEDELQRASEGWVADGLISAEQRARILARHPGRERADRRVVILSVLGAGVVVLGIAALVAANWGEIPRGVKVGAGLALMVALFAAGWEVRERRGRRRTGEAILFAASASFLGNLALIDQQYHRDTSVATLFFAQLVAMTPLVYLLRSRLFAAGAATVAFASVAALILEAPEASRFDFDDGFEGFLAVAGVGAAIASLGAAHRLSPWLRPLAAPIEVVGGGMFLFALFMLGFYRHDVPDTATPRSAILLLIILPLALATAVAAAGVLRAQALPGRQRAPIVALAATVVVALAWTTVVALWHRDPSGPDGGEPDFPVYTVGFWLLFAAVSAIVTWLGVAFDRTGWLNAGLFGIGVFVLARYFDLFSATGLTGVTFIGAGLLLLALAYVFERSRRALSTIGGGA